MLEKLVDTIKSRWESDASESYIASLLKAPVKHAAQKVAEEGVEVAIAAVSEDKQALTYEMADMLFHMLVLCERTGISFDDIVAELEKREGVSGHAEKAKRTQ